MFDVSRCILCFSAKIKNNHMTVQTIPVNIIEGFSMLCLNKPKRTSPFDRPMEIRFPNDFSLPQ